MSENCNIASSGVENKYGVLKMRDKIELICKDFLERIGNIITANQITELRFPITLAIPLIHAFFSSFVASEISLGNKFLDWLDGAVARSTKTTSSLGAKLDPAIDKLVHAIEMGYLAWNTEDLLFQIGLLINPLIDLYSHSKGGRKITLKEIKEAWVSSGQNNVDNDSSVKANIYGKIKTTLQGAAIILALASGNDEVSQVISTALLLTAAPLGFLGIIKRTRGKLHDFIFESIKEKSDMVE